MKFFGDEIGIEFVAFNFVHMMLFVLLIIGATLIYVFRSKFRNWKHERRFAKIVAVSAVVCEMLLYLWFILNGTWTWALSLPIGLCAFTLFIGIYALYTKKYQLFAIGYFWTWGALASVLFPDIPYSVDRFRFYQFMFGHMNFFFMYIYMILVYQWYPNWKDWKKSCIALSIIVVILIIASNVTGENLMYMLNGDGTPFEMFEQFGYIGYLVGVLTMSFGIILIWFLPFIIYHKRKK